MQIQKHTTESSIVTVGGMYFCIRFINKSLGNDQARMFSKFDSKSKPTVYHKILSYN